MNDDLRDQYQAEVRRLAADRAALLPKPSFRDKVRNLLRAKSRPLTVAPKHRISGPHQPALVDDGPGPQDACERGAWHTEEGQLLLPDPVYGPRCRECRLPVFAGGHAMLDEAGLCGPCRGLGPAAGIKPTALASHDEPPAAA